MASIGPVSGDKYNREANKVFPSKAYLERYKDPRIDPTLSHFEYLKGFHSFYKEHFSSRGGSKSVLELGGGPCLYSLVSAAKHVDNIVYAEYAETNRDEIKLWIDEEDGRHDWSKYVEYVVRDLEGDTAEDAVERREKEMREKIKEIIPCDVTNFDAFFDGEYQARQYDVVQSCFCMEAVYESQEAYFNGIAKLASYIKPGGYMIILVSAESKYQRYSFAGIEDCYWFMLRISASDVNRAIEMAGLVILKTVNVLRPDNVPDTTSKSSQFTLAQKKL